MNPINRFVSALRGRSASRGPASSDMRYEVANPARGTVLATRIKVAETAPQRSKGLLGREGLAPGEGLWIVPCESVHTFFMRFPIDLVYLDRKNKIKKVRSAIGAWRMSACLSAHSVLELPAGTIRDTQTQRGDILEFTSVSLPSDSAGAEGARAD